MPIIAHADESTQCLMWGNGLVKGGDNIYVYMYM